MLNPNLVTSMFTCPDLYPDGRTGYNLYPNERKSARTYYKNLRKAGLEIDKAKHIVSEHVRLLASI